MTQICSGNVLVAKKVSATGRNLNETESAKARKLGSPVSDEAREGACISERGAHVRSALLHNVGFTLVPNRSAENEGPDNIGHEHCVPEERTGRVGDAAGLEHFG